LVAEAFELVDESPFVAFGVLGVAAVEELFTELVVGDALVEDVVGGGEDLVAGRDGRFGVSAAALDAYACNRPISSARLLPSARSLSSSRRLASRDRVDEQAIVKSGRGGDRAARP
jgi:hypothetical protein